MNLDRIIHPVKSFADLDDEDVTAFLRDRTFGSENSNLEFKSAFPVGGNKSGARETCQLIVGFLNAEGGLVVYGVSDRVSEPAVAFPDYVSGLTEHPSPEELGQWVKESIYPPVDVPPMHVFSVAGRRVVILKILPGVNKPYCCYDQGSRAVWYFKRTGATTSALTPGEVREFYATAVIEQAAKLLRSGEFSQLATSQAANRRQKVEDHQKRIKPMLENIQDFGFVGIYAVPAAPVTIPWNALEEFVTKHRSHFSEEMSLYSNADTFQDAVSVGYFPRAVRPDVKSTFRITLYQDGMVALDSQADEFMGKYDDKNLNPFWLSYQIQRQLQMSRALLEGLVDAIHFVVDLQHVQDFHMSFQKHLMPGWTGSGYAGSHRAIEVDVAIQDIYPYNDGAKRNIVMPVVRDIMEEVGRIFGYPKVPSGPWDQNGYLMYVKGAERSR